MVWEDFIAQTMFFIKLAQNVVKKAISCYNILCFVTRTYIIVETVLIREKMNGKKR